MAAKIKARNLLSFVKSKLSSNKYPDDIGRGGHSTVVIGDYLYLWGGYQEQLPAVHQSEEKKKLTSILHVFYLHTGQWEETQTEGNPPLAISGYSCTSIDSSIYYFGGDCGHENCYHNSITCLDTTDLEWSEIFPTTIPNDNSTLPTRKTACGGMIHMCINEEDLLYIFGGYGLYPNNSSHYQYVLDTSNGLFRNNEQHVYNLTSGEWTNLVSTGQCPPPTNTHTLTGVSDNRAVLFGGRVDNDVSSDLYLCTFTSCTTVDWIQLSDPLTLIEWPLGRRSHSACTFTSVRNEYVVILGGEDGDNDHVSDCWLLDTNSLTWYQVHDIPEEVTLRSFHATSLFLIGPQCMWLTVTGGLFKELITGPAGALIIEISLNAQGLWTAELLVQGNEHFVNYQERFLTQLKKGRNDLAKELTTKRLVPTSTETSRQKTCISSTSNDRNIIDEKNSIYSISTSTDINSKEEKLFCDENYIVVSEDIG